MEPDSLSFLINLINEVQSHLVGVLRGLCFQDTQAKGPTDEQGTNAGRSNKYYHWPNCSNRKSAVIIFLSICILVPCAGENGEWIAHYPRLYGYV